MLGVVLRTLHDDVIHLLQLPHGEQTGKALGVGCGVRSLATVSPGEGGSRGHDSRGILAC